MGHRQIALLMCLTCSPGFGLASLSGCQRGGGADGGAGCDATPCAPPPGGLTPCGLAFCTAGQYGCNPGCSMCAKIGALCPNIHCGPAGPPCGGGFCPIADVCCNPSCGVCTPAGAPC